MELPASSSAPTTIPITLGSADCARLTLAAISTGKTAGDQATWMVVDRLNNPSPADLTPILDLVADRLADVHGAIDRMKNGGNPSENEGGEEEDGDGDGDGFVRPLSAIPAVPKLVDSAIKGWEAPTPKGGWFKNPAQAPAAVEWRRNLRF